MFRPYHPRSNFYTCRQWEYETENVRQERERISNSIDKNCSLSRYNHKRNEYSENFKNKVKETLILSRNNIADKNDRPVLEIICKHFPLISKEKIEP